MGKRSMKARKSMKRRSAMKKRSMKKKRVSKIARGKLAKSMVFRGSKVKTSGGLVQSSLMKNRTGKVVSKKMSQGAKKRYRNSKPAKWVAACQRARRAMNIRGFCAIGGKTAQGQAFLKKARS